MVVAKFKSIGARCTRICEGGFPVAPVHPSRVKPHKDAIPLTGEGPFEEKAKLHWHSAGYFDVEEGLSEGDASRSNC